MKKELFCLVFDATRYASELNIGDTVLLSHKDGRYVIWDGTNVYGYQNHNKTFMSEEDSLLQFVSKRLDARLIIWDNAKSNFLHDTMVEITALTDNCAIVVPTNDIQEMLKREEDEQLNAFFDNLIGSVLRERPSCEDTCENTCEDCKDCTEEKEEMKEETSVFSDLGASFGKVYGDQFRLSINGLAVRGKDGKYVTFNPETRELVEVTTGFFDEMKDLLFLMPATELEVGDIILHQNKPYYVTRVKDNEVRGIDFEEAVENILIPKTNVFGIKYFTKVFNCLGTNNILGSDIASNPMMAYALMGGKDFDLSKVMMFQALSGQGNGIADFSENPIMLMALMSNENGGGDLSNFAKMQILSQIAGNKKKETKPAKETKTN